VATYPTTREQQREGRVPLGLPAGRGRRLVGQQHREQDRVGVGAGAEHDQPDGVGRGADAPSATRDGPPAPRTTKQPSSGPSGARPARAASTRPTAVRGAAQAAAATRPTGVEGRSGTQVEPLRPGGLRRAGRQRRSGAAGAACRARTAWASRRCRQPDRPGDQVAQQRRPQPADHERIATRAPPSSPRSIGVPSATGARWIAVASTSRARCRSGRPPRAPRRAPADRPRPPARCGRRGPAPRPCAGR
jgi:hypothetical protein